MISRREFRETTSDLRQLLDRIEVSLLVRDPGSARSAEAYDGLRKSIAAAARERHQHLVQLVELSDAIERGASVDTLGERAGEWCAQAGLVRTVDTSQEELYEITGGDGDLLVVDSPAWVDPQAGVVIKRGLAHRTSHTAPPAVQAPEEDPSFQTAEEER